MLNNLVREVMAGPLLAVRLKIQLRYGFVSPLKTILDLKSLQKLWQCLERKTQQRITANKLKDLEAKANRYMDCLKNT